MHARSSPVDEAEPVDHLEVRKVEEAHDPTRKGAGKRHIWQQQRHVGEDEGRAGDAI